MNAFKSMLLVLSMLSAIAAATVSTEEGLTKLEQKVKMLELGQRLARLDQHLGGLRGPEEPGEGHVVHVVLPAPEVGLGVSSGRFHGATSVAAKTHLKPILVVSGQTRPQTRFKPARKPVLVWI